MAGTHLEDAYGTYGSVPQPVEVNGTGGQPIHAQASENDFGGNIDQAITGAANQAQETIQKFQGMQNETFATNADVALSAKMGEIKGQFKSLSGQEAVDALPKTLDSINKAFQETRAGLPPAAAQGFDSMAKRSLGYSMGEVNEYAAGQFKAANNQSAINGLVQKQMEAKDPSVANDDTRFGETLGDIKHFSAQTLDTDHPGFSKDDNGQITGYKDDENGVALHSNYKDLVDYHTGVAWTNRYDTLAKQDPIAAMSNFQENKSQIPPVAAVDIEATLQPQVDYAQSKKISDVVKINADQEHQKILLNPNKDDDGLRKLGHWPGLNYMDSTYDPVEQKFAPAINPENQKGVDAVEKVVKSGGSQEDAYKAYIAAGGKLTQKTSDVSQQLKTAIFSQESSSGTNAKTSIDGSVGPMQITPDTWDTWKKLGIVKEGENINNAVDNKAAGERAIDYYLDKYHGDAARASVAYHSGPGNVSPEGSPTPYINNTHDGLGKTVSDYVSDVQGRMGNGSQQDNSKSAIPPKPYATTPDGAKYNSPDYYADHKEEILMGVRAEAERQYPGNLAVANGAVAQMRLVMDSAIADQKNRYGQDNKYATKGISGELSNGKPPTTLDELRKLPGMEDVLKRIPSQDPKFYEAIPKMLEEYNKQDVTSNGKNAYETIQRVLMPDTGAASNRIYSQDQLDKILGRSDGTGINKKDYNDSKAALAYSDTIKSEISKQMNYIRNANGNVDGKGNERAVMWYNQASKIIDKNSSQEKGLPDIELMKNLEKTTSGYMPSRQQQLNQAARLSGAVPPPPPQSGKVMVINDKGVKGYIPSTQLDEALKSGFKKVE